MRKEDSYRVKRVVLKGQRNERKEVKGIRAADRKTDRDNEKDRKKGTDKRKE